MESSNTRSTFVPLYKIMLFVCALLMFMIGGVKTAWARMADTFRDYNGRYFSSKGLAFYYDYIDSMDTGNTQCRSNSDNGTLHLEYGYQRFISDANKAPSSITGSTSLRTINSTTWMITSTATATENGFWSTRIYQGGPHAVTAHWQVPVFLYDNETIYTEAYGHSYNTDTEYIRSIGINKNGNNYYSGFLGAKSGITRFKTSVAYAFNDNGNVINDSQYRALSTTDKNKYHVIDGAKSSYGYALAAYKDRTTGLECYIVSPANKNGGAFLYLLKNVPANLTAVQILPYFDVEYHSSYYDDNYPATIMPEVGTRVGNADLQKVVSHTHSDKDNDGACDECGKVYRSRHTLTVNGKLNGSDSGNTGSYGTFNLKIDGRNLMSGQTSWSGYIADGTSYTITPSAKSGYRYMGANSGGTSLPASKGTISDTMPASDRTVRLSFDSIYTIVFNGNNANGGSTSSMNNLAYSDSKVLSQNGFYRYGYSFSGWAGNANGNGSSYSDKQTVSKLSSTPNGKVTLYAKWTPVTYKVYYTLFGSTATLTRTYNIEMPTFTLNKPSYEGYTFKGWVGGIDMSDREVHGKTYDNPTMNVSIEKGSYGDHFFRAIFTKNHQYDEDKNVVDEVYVASSKPKETYYGTNAYRITYELNGGSISGEKSFYTADDVKSGSYTPPIPTRTGCTFLGWTPASIPQNHTGNVTFTASWKANNLGTISYELNGGSITGQKTSYTADDYGYIPPVPTRANYSFTGWNPSSIPYDSTGNITFTALWSANKVGTISYNLNGGTITGQKTEYTVEDYGYTPPVPKKDGYTFTGWSPEGILNGSKGNITFTANWKENTLTIQYHTNGADTEIYMQDNQPHINATFDPNTDTVRYTAIQKYDDHYDSEAVDSNAANGLWNPTHFLKTGYHLTNGNYWRVTNNGKLVFADESFSNFTGADIANFLGVLDAFKYNDVTVDLIPEWSANTYTVKYDQNAPSGTTVSGTTSDSTHTYDTDKTLTANGYSINNYKFLSWNTKKDGTGTSYTDGATVKNLTTENNGTVTLYAQWKQDIITVNIPSLTNTSFTMDGNTKSPTVDNLNSTYVNQSGTTSAIDANTYTITWSLKDKTKYRWSDGSTGDKSATWKINWVNGTSHYSNDIYNRGWGTPLPQNPNPRLTGITVTNASTYTILTCSSIRTSSSYDADSTGELSAPAGKHVTVEGYIADYTSKTGLSLSGTLELIETTPNDIASSDKNWKWVNLYGKSVGNSFKLTISLDNTRFKMRLSNYNDGNGYMGMYGTLTLHITRIYWTN